MFGATEHIMLDLETLGVCNNPVILSIGAAKFDENGVFDTFYTVVDVKSCTDCGLQIEASTVGWWMRQSEAAKAVFSHPSKQQLYDALFSFFTWAGRDQKRPIWSNGANADLVWLKSAVKALDMELPWTFQDERCYRTILAAFPGRAKVSNPGTAHRADCDAKYQAEVLVAIWETLNL